MGGRNWSRSFAIIRSRKGSVGFMTTEPANRRRKFTIASAFPTKWKSLNPPYPNIELGKNNASWGKTIISNMHAIIANQNGQMPLKIV